MLKEIRMVIVDDSRIFRGFTEKAISKIPNVKVVASLWSGEKALDYIRANEVDLVTLDIEMPGIGGLETLKTIQELNKENGTNIGVIMLSSLTHNGALITMDALELGAFDFIAKPAPDENGAFEKLERELTSKIHAWTKAHIPSAARAILEKPAPAAPVKIGKGAFDLICIGVSTGGPKSLQRIMPDFCAQVNCPILIVQHMPPGFTESLANGLNKKCDNYTVTEAKEGDVVSGKKMLIAPGGNHMVLREKMGNIVVGLNNQPPENGCRPSVDVLFRTVAQLSKGKKVLSIILTGMGNDGTAGLRPLKRAGAVILAQDEESSVVWGMPGSAVASGNVNQVVALDDFPRVISELQQ